MLCPEVKGLTLNREGIGNIGLGLRETWVIFMAEHKAVPGYPWSLSCCLSSVD